MARQYKFRGKSLEEIKALDLKGYSELLNSRQRRSIKRMGHEYKELIAKVNEAIESKSDKPIKTHIREAVILPNWVGLRFGIYNGKEFKDVLITEEMLGHRLGEFSFSTKRVIHSAPGIRATRGSKFLEVK
ncbi:MAG: 30S ribosomal protein S19 [Candidatus Micrarchaeia archaeon]